MSQSPVLRFAPSPNGRLHLGHAYSALFTEQEARRLGGLFLLRLENIDPVRCKPEFCRAVEEDLHWLGLTWPEPVMQQSTRMQAYGEAAAILKRVGLLYPCFCSRRQVGEAATGSDPDGAPLYPGTCRALLTEETLARMGAGAVPQWRLDMELASARIGPISFSEHGHMVQARPDRWGDAVLVRRDTPTSYHLAVVVDDAAQGVTHVTRGADLLAATDLHALLQALLGLQQPLYQHHRLITDENQQKLSKSRASPSLKGLREAGWSPADVRARLGFA